MDGARDLVSTHWPALDVGTKRAQLETSLRLSPGPLDAAIAAATGAASRAAGGLMMRDPSTWSGDPAVQRSIANRLGWLDAPLRMADSLDRLRGFADRVRADGFTDVVLLGMGGSSLAPEVLRAVIGSAPGWPRLHVLDSTNPAAVLALQAPPEGTLFVVASKSGTTIEPDALAAHFRRLVEAARGPGWSRHFVAITDEGTELARRARADGFRDLFINPSDIGGRYSALSFFGLVPAALMGQDLPAIVGWALAMLAAAESGFGEGTANPAAALGLALGAAAHSGRDKLTLVIPEALAPFGLWIEQLVAESTGKQGRGIVPIAGERLAPAAAYGDDRFFVRIGLRGDDARPGEADLRDLEAAGMPCADIALPEPAALGAEFVRWEMATAVAGALLHVNPFDEPNVQQAKEATRALLARYGSEQRLPIGAPDLALDDGTTFTLSAAARASLAGGKATSFLSLLGRGDYLGLLAYVGAGEGLSSELRALRAVVRDRTRAATTYGDGPRYLHSTGQLHKGGANTGVFVLLTAAPHADVPIPGRPFSFGTLELAQALGDFASLDQTGRRALHIHLPSPEPALVRRVRGLLLDSLPGA
ncbi:MAG: glucose-6-phosphate isomerase [Acidobacteria bacterium]|nr:glucose-6-phosphate isomerase [Acidobacteriota bacterium]